MADGEVDFLGTGSSLRGHYDGNIDQVLQPSAAFGQDTDGSKPLLTGRCSRPNQILRLS